jgi:hypothetical protein
MSEDKRKCILVVGEGRGEEADFSAALLTVKL